MRSAHERIKDMIAVILGGGRGSRLDPLTRLRSKPAVPIAGKYRLIDIPVSNCINSGLERLFILTQFNSFSLHRHISLSYKFDLFSRGYAQILAAEQRPGHDRWFQGTADAVRQNLRLFTEARGDLVLILSGDHMYRMDYREMLRAHVDAEADITLSLLPCSEMEIGEFGAVRVNDAGAVLEFREKPGTEEAREGMKVARKLLEERGVPHDRPYLASMGIYIFNKRVLNELLSSPLDDFGQNVIPAAVENGLKVHSHFFTGYWRDIGTIRAFFDAHMDMVGEDPPFSFNDTSWPFFTHPRFPPGAKIHDVRIDHSILSDGAEIESCSIEGSVVGLRSVMKKVRVKESLLMGADPYPADAPDGAPPLGIGEGSVIERAIIDKNARIGQNVRIIGSDDREDSEGDGWAVREGIVIVQKNAVIPDNSVL
jgi:glucose-1-phosphate adenylyltransferase